MDDFDRLLVRYLGGDASEVDETEVRRWMMSDPANEDQLARLQEAWAAAGMRPGGSTAQYSARYDTSAELARLLKRIAADEGETISFASRPSGVSRNVRWYASPFVRAAAVLAVVTGTAVLLSTAFNPFPGGSIQTFTTKTGERITLTLEDGSRVVLGPESRVRAASRFRSRAREVRLEGTAFFEVEHDADRPFDVHAGGSVVRAIGTSFVVRAYADEHRVDVGVAEGRVAVRAETAPEVSALVLTVGQFGRVEGDGAARLVEDGALEQILAWTEGRLVFRELPLSGVVRELQRWYDAEISVPDDGLAARLLTLSFQNAPLAEVLEIIAFSLDARVEVDGRSVTIRPSQVRR